MGSDIQFNTNRHLFSGNKKTTEVQLVAEQKLIT